MGLFLAITFLAMLGLGAFEVGLSLRAGQQLGLSITTVGLLFTECALVMLLCQLIWSWRPGALRHSLGWIKALFIITSGSLVLLLYASDFLALTLVIALFGIATGLLVPMLAYRTSLAGGRRIGSALGWYTAVASLGQAAGSVVPGLAVGEEAVFLYWGVAAALVVSGMVVCRIAPRSFSNPPRS
ncbi:MFS transporter [Marinobacteraceae bacterium S3BR75-40.1]